MRFVRQFNREELQFLSHAVKSCKDSDIKTDINALIEEAILLREYNDNFCEHLKALTTRFKILKKINNQYEDSVLLGEAAGTYYDKLKRNEIFSDKEILIVSVIKNYFNDKKILEIGCGAGQMAIYLKLNNINIETCDFTPYRQSLTRQMCGYFNVEIPFYNEPFQNLDLNKYDVIIAANIRSSKNNFSKDRALFDNFLLNKDKYVILDYAEYSVNEEDREDLQNFTTVQIDRVLDYIKQRNANELRYATL